MTSLGVLDVTALLAPVPGEQPAGADLRTADPNAFYEVKDLRRETGDLKEALAEAILENRLLKKSMIGDGGDPE